MKPPVSPGVIVFHAGTRHDERTGKLLTAGGRIFAVTAVQKDLSAAYSAAYTAVEMIHFEGRAVRRDIGAKALASDSHHG